MKQLRHLGWVLLVLGLCFGNTPHAFAHAALIGSEPADGSIIAKAPERIVLRFNEPVSPLVLKLIAPDGSTTELEGATWSEDALAIPISGALGRGTHVLSWRVISQDGHPIGGSLVFSMGYREPGIAGDLADEAPALRPVIWLLRLTFYLTLFQGVGAVVFRSWFAVGGRFRPSLERLIGVTLGLVIPTAVLSIGALGLDALAAPWHGLTNLAVWRAGLSSSYATTAALAGVASLLALIAQWTNPGWQNRLLSLLALALVGLALTASGHAASAPPQLLSRTAVFIHAVCLTVWLGALLPLAGLILTRTRSHVAFQRFSTWIPLSVAALIVSGLVLAVLQLKPLNSIFTTSYGQLLLLKLLLVACLLGLAAYNRYGLTARVVAGDPRARRYLLRTIGIELLLAFAILGTVALWRFTPPPRSMLASSSEITFHLHGANLMAHMRLVPGRKGRNVITVDLGNVEPKEVKLSIENGDSGIEPIRRDAVATNGTWSVPDLTIPVSGRWTLRLDILIDDFQSARLEGSFAIP